MTFCSSHAWARLRSSGLQLLAIHTWLFMAATRSWCEDVVTVTEGVAKHAAIEKPARTISLLARQMKVSGRVEVLIQISEEGSVSKAKVVSGNPLLAESVLIAVKNWK